MLGALSLVIINDKYYEDVEGIQISEDKILLDFIQSDKTQVEIPYNSNRMLIKADTSDDVCYGETSIRNVNLRDKGCAYVMGNVGTGHTTNSCIAFGNVGSVVTDDWEGIPDIENLREGALESVENFKYCESAEEVVTVIIRGKLNGVLNLSTCTNVSFVQDKVGDKCFIGIITCKNLFCRNAKKLIVDGKFKMYGEGMFINAPITGSTKLTPSIDEEESIHVLKKELQQTTWQQIVKDVRAGLTVGYAGAEIGITLKDGTEVVLVVVATNHYYANELVFAFRDYLNEPRQMYNDGNITRGWIESDLRRWLNVEFFKLLPDDLRKVICGKRTVKVVNGKQYECEDLLFLPTEMEMFGKPEEPDKQLLQMEMFSELDKMEEQEEEQFPYYADKLHRCRILGKEGVFECGWLLPSLGTNELCYVTHVGESKSCPLDREFGVAPVFVIR